MKIYNITEVVFMSNNVDEFISAINEYYQRNKSIVDTMSKCEDQMGRFLRSVTKSATGCGCVTYYAKKQKFNMDGKMSLLMEGKPCKNCKDIIKTEAGQLLFYIFALCNSFGVDINEIINSETEIIKTLGRFNLR